jgi:alpha-L-fucosidase
MAQVELLTVSYARNPLRRRDNIANSGDGGLDKSQVTCSTTTAYSPPPSNNATTNSEFGLCCSCHPSAVEPWSKRCRPGGGAWREAMPVLQLSLGWGSDTTTAGEGGPENPPAFTPKQSFMKTSAYRYLLACAAVVALTFPLSAAPADSSETREQHNARMKWFKEARFGMFIHWGVYSVPAGVWQGRDVSGIGEWIYKHGKIPIKDYKAFAQDFTAAKYDPKAWADLAREAGMKYVVLTAKHHEGFALYDSKVSDWNAVKSSGAKRDLIAPLAKAVRDDGLKFGLYYSQAQDWTHPGGAIWHVKEGEPGWDPAHAGNFDEYLKEIAIPQTKELLTLYKPDILWWDTPDYMTPERAKPLHDALALFPGIISNDRLGGGYKGDTKTPEQKIPPRGYPGEMFEVCMTMNDTWGYKKNDHNWKSVSEILRNLSDISSKGGNFLLNVGPTAEGVIPEESVERLKAVGRWMAVNGEAIYATEASPFPRRLPWGRITSKPGGNTSSLYLHIWEWPEDGKLLLPTLKELPTGGRMLSDGAKVASEATADGIEVTLPGGPRDPNISVAVLTFDKPLTITQEPYVAPGADGKLTFTPFDADTHGGYTGTVKVIGTGGKAYLGNWMNPEWMVEYLVNSPDKRTWGISAEIAAEKAVTLVVGPKGETTEVKIPATGGNDQWQTVDLGTVDLPKGASGVQLLGAKSDWAPIQIRNVTFTPR